VSRSPAEIILALLFSANTDQASNLHPGPGILEPEYTHGVLGFRTDIMFTDYTQRRRESGKQKNARWGHQGTRFVSDERRLYACGEAGVIFK
jgi:hypothetical protein